MTEMQNINLRTPKTNLDAAQVYADHHGITRSAALNLAIARGLAALGATNCGRSEASTPC